MEMKFPYRRMYLLSGRVIFPLLWERDRGLTPLFVEEGQSKGCDPAAASSSSITKAQWLLQGRACEGTSVALSPTQPAQLTTPINNPDPEISGRSYNQSSISPEAALQTRVHGAQRARFTLGQHSRVLSLTAGLGPAV